MVQLLSLGLLVTLSACASQAQRVNCNGRLVPINPPPEVVKPAPAKAVPKKEVRTP
jgi:hypothetical protein